VRKKLIKKCKGKIFVFEVFEEKIGKAKIKRDVVKSPKAVGILPLIDKDKVILIRQFRFAINKEIWEIPAGKLDRGEKPEIGAKRELKEETGYEARELKKIGEFYLSPGYSTEYMYLFLARRLKKGEQNLDKGEKIKEVKIFSKKEVLKMIKSRKIVDAKTILALFFFGLDLIFCLVNLKEAGKINHFLKVVNLIYF
jgi:ADP-ribose pyrophosphatase